MNLNIDKIAKYIGIAGLHYALYHLVVIGKLEVMYFYGIAGATLTGLGIHGAVTTPYFKGPAAVQFNPSPKE